MRPGDGEVPKMLARMYHRAGEPLKAIAELEQHIERNPGVFERGSMREEAWVACFSARNLASLQAAHGEQPRWQCERGDIA
eukprot:907120-Pelagomonas_calceolata.AAC.2